ncbi:anti-sigma factor [Elioraea rosea]|uniref:anti-sigma factor n=1 Tax=Elioraea rosea TaxID=2492390 RepID=UPI00118541F8|nr:anti-sigma factor [Elioraea rosea]
MSTPLFPPLPDSPEEREALAAEYVLGTLEAREATMVRAAMESDAAFRAVVLMWEARLAPLARAIPEAEPPAGLLARIEARLDDLPAPLPAPRGASLRVWKGWAVASTAIAAGLAAFLILRPAPEPAEPRFVAVLQQDQAAPAWVVEATREGGIMLAGAVNPRPRDEGRVLQLWGLYQGESQPVSLGLVPPDGRLAVDPRVMPPREGMLIEISLEPPGGSPIGRPTGPVLFIGRLERVN